MSKYIPPHLRNKPVQNEETPKFEERPRYNRNRNRNYEERPNRQAQEEEKQKIEEKSREKTEENFPTLIRPITREPAVWGKNKTFAELAAEWSTKSKEEQEIENQKKMNNEKRKNDFDSYKNRQTLPRFNNVRRFVEKDDNGEIVEELPENLVIPIDQGWTKIQKKTKKEKTFEQKMEELEAEENKEKEESVWQATQEVQEYETYWDEKY